MGDIEERLREDARWKQMSWQERYEQESASHQRTMQSGIDAVRSLADEIARLKAENTEMRAGLHEECTKRLDAEIALNVLLKATRDEPERLAEAQAEGDAVLNEINEEGSRIEAALTAKQALIEKMVEGLRAIAAIRVTGSAISEANAVARSLLTNLASPS